MPKTQIESPLRVHEMRVIWRDTFIVEDTPPNFLDASQEKLRRLACYAGDSEIEPDYEQPDLLRVLNRVSRSIAPIGHPVLRRFEFAPIEFTNLLPTLDKYHRAPDKLTERQMRDAGLDADYANAWIKATPILLLHQAGVGIMQYHITVRSKDGLTPDQVIDHVRMGIHDQLMTLDEGWRCLLPDKTPDWPVKNVYAVGPNRHLLVCGFRDLTRGVIAARLGASVSVPDPIKRRSRWPRIMRRDDGSIKVLPPRPTGSASIVLVDVDPKPGADFDAYCKEHSAALRGMGGMDADWRNRAQWLIDRELGDNLSTDAELGMYLLGTSELLLFNDGVWEAADYYKRKMRLADRALGVTYFYAHYSAMMEWVYLQEALLRWYLRRVDALTAAPSPHRRTVISTVQGALGDLVQYQEDVTPYATRVEFLQRAAEYRKLNTMADRFDLKQERLIDYTAEYHDYREARAAEFLNYLAAILTGAALAELIVTLFGIAPGVTPNETALYLGIYGGSILVVLGIMTLLLRRV